MVLAVRLQVRLSSTTNRVKSKVADVMCGVEGQAEEIAKRAVELGVSAEVEAVRQAILAPRASSSSVPSSSSTPAPQQAGSSRAPSPPGQASWLAPTSPSDWRTVSDALRGGARTPTTNQTWLSDVRGVTPLSQAVALEAAGLGGRGSEIVAGRSGVAPRRVRPHSQPTFVYQLS